MSKVKQVIFKDFFWYAVGMIIPMVINLVKTPIFTRHYSAEDYGYLGLVMMVFMYLSTVSYSWLASCIWRYYNAFEKKKILPKFYANISFLYVISTILILFFGLVVITFYHEPFLVFKLVIVCFFHFITKELVGLYNVILRVKGEAKKSNLITIAQVLCSFVVLCFFAFQLDFDITALLSSSVLIDSLFILGLAIYLKINKRLNWLKFNLVNRSYLKIFFQFGSFILLSSLATLLIVSSDRYVLAMYDTIENVGIYTKVYDIAQLSITAFIFVYFSVINPKMNRELTHDAPNTNPLLQEYLYVYLVTLLPIVAFISMFSQEVAILLLGEEFRNGYTIMPYVFFSAFVYGLITFNLNKLKFTNRLKSILIILIVTFAVNLVLNFIVIPTYGYYGAAITTLITYSLMLILFFIADDLGVLKQLKKFKIIGLQLIVLLLFYGVTRCIRTFYSITVFVAIVLGIIYLLLFGLIFIRTYKNLKLPH